MGVRYLVGLRVGGIRHTRLVDVTRKAIISASCLRLLRKPSSCAPTLQNTAALKKPIFVGIQTMRSA